MAAASAVPIRSSSAAGSGPPPRGGDPAPRLAVPAPGDGRVLGHAQADLAPADGGDRADGDVEVGGQEGALRDDDVPAVEADDRADRGAVRPADGHAGLDLMLDVQCPFLL